MSAKARISETTHSATLQISSLRITVEKPKVLVVEDHDDSREMLRMLLERRGCRVTEACNGMEAVESARRELPALILMDGSLPFLDGLGATRLIRTDPVSGKIPIVGLNGWGSASYHAAALAAGCDDCLEKPIDFEKLESYLVPLFRPGTQSSIK